MVSPLPSSEAGSPPACKRPDVPPTTSRHSRLVLTEDGGSFFPVTAVTGHPRALESGEVLIIALHRGPSLHSDFGAARVVAQGTAVRDGARVMQQDLFSRELGPNGPNGRLSVLARRVHAGP